MLPWSVCKPRKPPRKRKSRPAWLVPPAKTGTALPQGRKNAPDRRADGEDWELRAARWLQDRGLQPVAMHVAGRRGEIDLIMACGSTAVIIEVRCRRSNAHGTAADSIDWCKRQRIIHTSLLWWVREGRHRFKDLRFDTVTFGPDRQAQWQVHAFDIEGSI